MVSKHQLETDKTTRNKWWQILLVVAILAAAFSFATVSYPSVTHAASAHEQVPLSDICQTYTRTIGAFLSYGKVTADLCYNGSQAWYRGGIDCSAIVLPPFTFVKTTWCGWSVERGDYTEVGENYLISSVGGGQTTQYVRMKLYNNGTVQTYGGV